MTIHDVCLKSDGIGVTIYFNSQPQTTFKLTPFQTNASFHPSLSRFYVRLEGFFLDAPKLCHYIALDGHHTFKTNPLDDSFVLGENKKIKK